MHDDDAFHRFDARRRSARDLRKNINVLEPYRILPSTTRRAECGDEQVNVFGRAMVAAGEQRITAFQSIFRALAVQGASTSFTSSIPDVVIGATFSQ